MKMLEFDGCKEPGNGQGHRYRCDHGGCDFDLHVACALRRPPLSTLSSATATSSSSSSPCRAPPPVDKTFCIARRLRTPGLVYHSFAKDLDLHPTCAALKMEKSAFHGGHLVAQLICWDPPAADAEHHHRCVVCHHGAGAGGGKKFWAYRWGYGGTLGHLHLACMKKVAFQSWEQAYMASVGGGLVEASVPTMAAAMQKKRTDEFTSGVKIIDTGIRGQYLFSSTWGT